MAHRRAERSAQKRSRPRALAATGPDQVFCWDITYLPTQVRGQHFYLYLFEDLFSRKIVGWQVFDCESAELASQLLRDICARHSIPPGQLTVHSDNGAPMKGETMLATMQRLGVAHTRSRPSVSNDKDYVAYCTPSVRSGGTVASRRRCESLAPGFLRGARSPGGSYKDSFLSL